MKWKNSAKIVRIKECEFTLDQCFGLHCVKKGNIFISGMQIANMDLSQRLMAVNENRQMCSGNRLETDLLFLKHPTSVEENSYFAFNSKTTE